MEKLEKCPLCDSENIGHFMDSIDYSISKELFSIARCKHCSFLFTNPRPDENAISHYYQSEKYISHSDKSHSLIDVLYKFVRNHTLNQKLKLINSLSAKGKVLDYGCGTGHFLKTCRANGWHTYGIEPEETARKIAIANTKNNIVAGMKDLTATDFQIITLWHVLEHVHQLHGVFRQLVSKLSKTGSLVIALPNHKSYDAKVYQQYWAAYDLPRHLYHFSQETLTLLANEYELKVGKILPMKFDSYYVSMLSDKYKTGKNALLKSTLTGCKSNIYAKKNKEYSSLIYILNK